MAIGHTVILVLYSEDATVPDSKADASLDNNDKRSAASESKSTEAESPNRTCNQ